MHNSEKPHGCHPPQPPPTGAPFPTQTAPHVSGPRFSASNAHTWKSPGPSKILPPESHLRNSNFMGLRCVARSAWACKSPAGDYWAAARWTPPPALQPSLKPPPLLCLWSRNPCTPSFARSLLNLAPTITATQTNSPEPPLSPPLLRKISSVSSSPHRDPLQQTPNPSPFKNPQSLTCCPRKSHRSSPAPPVICPPPPPTASRSPHCRMNLNTSGPPAPLQLRGAPRLSSTLKKPLHSSPLLPLPPP